MTRLRCSHKPAAFVMKLAENAYMEMAARSGDTHMHATEDYAGTEWWPCNGTITQVRV